MELKDKVICNLPDNSGRKVWVYMDKEGNPYILINGERGELDKNISNFERKWWVASIFSTDWSKIYSFESKEFQALIKLMKAWDLEHKEEYR